MGTSAPEFAVSINAALKSLPSISIGNIVGSNIFNLGFILGTIAIIKPVKTGKTVVYRDGVFLLAITLLLLFFIVNTTPYIISRFEGILFISILIIYLGYLFFKSKNIPFDDNTDYVNEEEAANITYKDYLLLLSGIIMIYLGGEFLVNSSTSLAKAVGISEWVIGVTIVAAGTSAPEFVTSLVAVLKGKSEISIGNLIGSDLFNILGVLGLAAFIRPLTVETAAVYSLIMLVFMVALVWVFMKTGWEISKKEGIILVLIGALRWIVDFKFF